MPHFLSFSISSISISNDLSYLGKIDLFISHYFYIDIAH